MSVTKTVFIDDVNINLNNYKMKSTKQWWAISIATLYVARHPEDSFHYEYYHLAFDNLHFSFLPTRILLDKFHEFSCEEDCQEEHRNESNCDNEPKCAYEEFFKQKNENAKITLEETTNGAEIKIETSQNFTTKLTLNCLNGNGTFDLDESKKIAFETILNICDILKINSTIFFKFFN